MRNSILRLGAASGAAIALALPLAPAAVATTPRLHYVGYAAGLRVLELDVDLDIEPDSYRVVVSLHTVGLFGAVVSGLTTTEVTGSWAGLDAVPHRYASDGVWRGRPLRAILDYAPGGPNVHDLLPDPDPEEHEPVPAELQTGTIDSLSAMAGLLHRVAQTGACETQARVFDGRRLSDVAAHTVGPEILPQTSRSVFQGQALRCDFVGRQLGGFEHEEDHARAARPHDGSAWFATLTPGGPLVPVRMVFETRFFGHATMYLAPPPG